MSIRAFRAPAALLLLSLCLPAQEAERGGPSGPARSDSQEAVITLSFPGGTMAEFVQAVRTIEPTANIVMASLATDAVLPPIDVRSASLDQVLDCACTVAEGGIEVAVKRFKGPGRSVFTILGRLPRTNRGTTVDQAGNAEEAIVQRVFSLNDLTRPRAGGMPAAMPVETVISAVELASTVGGSVPLLRYHSESGLLLVRGTHEQVGYAVEALQVLRDDLSALEFRERTERGADSQRSADTKATGGEQTR